MHTARTLLVLVSFVGGLMEVASAQHKVHFPAVRVWRGLGIDLDGAGIGWQHDLHFFGTGPLFYNAGFFRKQSLRNAATGGLRNERGDNPEDSDAAGHGGFVWHGGSRLR